MNWNVWKSICALVLQTFCFKALTYVQQTISKMMKVQVVFGEDVRDWQHPETYKYDDLQKFILKSFDLSQDDIEDVVIEYIDDENDFVRIDCDEDLNDAFECENNQFKKSLKLFVKTRTKTNNKKNTESNSVDNWLS